MRLELRTEDYPPVTAGNAQMPASATAGAAVLAAIEPPLGLKLESRESAGGCSGDRFSAAGLPRISGLPVREAARGCAMA